MLPETLTTRAIKIAAKAHAGQTEKDGVTSYFEHVHRVATQMAMADGTEEEIAAAYLHDVIEDTPLDGRALYDLGIPVRVVEIVQILTRSKAETYATYIERVAFDREAKRIKIADLLDHLRPGGKCPESLVPRYEKALKELTE